MGGCWRWVSWPVWLCSASGGDQCCMRPAASVLLALHSHMHITAAGGGICIWLQGAGGCSSQRTPQKGPAPRTYRRRCQPGGSRPSIGSSRPACGGGPAGPAAGPGAAGARPAAMRWRQRWRPLWRRGSAGHTESAATDAAAAAQLVRPGARAASGVRGAAFAAFLRRSGGSSPVGLAASWRCADFVSTLFLSYPFQHFASVRINHNLTQSHPGPCWSAPAAQPLRSAPLTTFSTAVHPKPLPAPCKPASFLVFSVACTAAPISSLCLAPPP